MKLVKFFILSLLVLTCACSYAPYALNMEKISSIPEELTESRQGKSIALLPITDNSKLPQNIGYAQSLSGYSKSVILITEPPAYRLQKDLMKGLKLKGYNVRYSQDENTSLPGETMLSVNIDTFDVSSKKIDWFRHEVSAGAKLTVVSINPATKERKTNKLEVNAFRKVMFLDAGDYEKTALTAWNELLISLLNDDILNK